MVTTRNQAKKDHNLVTNTSEEGPSELTGSTEIVKDIPIIDAPNSNLASTQEEAKEGGGTNFDASKVKSTKG